MKKNLQKTKKKNNPVVRNIKQTYFYSKSIGSLPRGCRLCVKGRKLVLFVTGLCSNRCFFCPISEQKKDKDVVYANEWPTSDIKNIIKEAELCNALGAGITGGDPLVKIDRVIKYIKALKKNFGKEFHIHIYTPLKLVSSEILKRLEKAGLDELRFHPSFHDKKDFSEWKRMKAVQDINKIDFGIEIPVVPDKKKEMLQLIDYVSQIKNIKFINLNELEISDTNACRLTEKGYKTKDNISYGISGSEKLANELLEYCSKNTKLKIHYCTTTLKDKVQLAKRIKLRAKSVSHSFEMIDSEGMIKRYAVYYEELKPGFSYNKILLSLAKNKRNKIEEKLKKLRLSLIKKNKLNSKEIVYDKERLRLLTSYAVINKIKKLIKERGFIPARIIEYPTHDALIVELDFL